MTSAKADNYYPVVCGAVVSLVYLGVFEIYPKYALLKGFRDLFVAAVSINAISIGFLATAKATLISMNNSKVVKWMKEAGIYKVTIKYFMDAVNFALMSTVWSAVLLLIDFNDPTKYILFAIAVWLFLSTTSVLAMYRIIKLFSKILLKA